MDVSNSTLNTKTEDCANGATLTSQVIYFPTPINAAHSKPGWICNVSQEFSLVSASHEHIQITPNDSYSQFELVSKLLAVNTCRAIYFDAQFSNKQLERLRQLQSQTRTKLFNAKMAYLFSTQKIDLHA